MKLRQVVFLNEMARNGRLARSPQPLDRCADGLGFRFHPPGGAGGSVTQLLQWPH